MGETRPEIRAREGVRFWVELDYCGKMWEPIHYIPLTIRLPHWERVPMLQNVTQPGLRRRQVHLE